MGLSDEMAGPRFSNKVTVRAGTVYFDGTGLRECGERKSGDRARNKVAANTNAGPVEWQRRLPQLYLTSHLPVPSRIGRPFHKALRRFLHTLSPATAEARPHLLTKSAKPSLISGEIRADSRPDCRLEQLELT